MTFHMTFQFTETHFKDAADTRYICRIKSHPGVWLSCGMFMYASDVPRQIEYATWFREQGLSLFLHDRFFLIGHIFSDATAMAWRMRWT
jgi:hypothetical protein